jgi:multiple sugar transport system ATP-binding protein
LTPVLEISNLSVSYNDTEVLTDISLTLESCELLAILGPTGVGKTTLLRTIAGLESPDRGDIRIDGKSMTNAMPADRDVALVFQNFSLYPDRTVRQNLEFPLRAPSNNINEDEIQSRVKWAADLLNIQNLLDRPSTQLSGGEMQRVAIGRAIVRRPKIFLLDEPLTNLDAKLRESLRVELITLQRELEVPMVYVTHDQAEALSMANRVAVLFDGQIAQAGSPCEIYETPVSSDVAKQLGYPPINLLSVSRHEDSWMCQQTPIAQAGKGSQPSAVLGIRPENVRTSGGSVPASIRVVEDLGPTRVLLVNWAGTDIHIVTDKLESHAPDDIIYPSPDPNRVLVWEDDTTQMERG